MRWCVSYRADPRARAIADRHYTRQSPGHPQFVPPGRCLVLLARPRKERSALWITSWPFPEYVKHAWPGAWICSLFRNEGVAPSVSLITQAIAATRAYMGKPPEIGMVTFVRPEKVLPKPDPGRCFIEAGFEPCGTTGKGYLAFRLPPERMPPAQLPRGLVI